ncbi:hypothetical protein TNCV_3855871 [Trichonephila clavipes]|nr:hypothetical protein TNCV_3855871 [Trichonephila clavipes]
MDRRNSPPPPPNHPYPDDTLSPTVPRMDHEASALNNRRMEETLPDESRSVLYEREQILRIPIETLAPIAQLVKYNTVQSVGARLVGCCENVASALWYLGYWRHNYTLTKTPSLGYADTLQDAATGWSSDDSASERIGYFKDSFEPGVLYQCISLTPSPYRLRCQWYQKIAHGGWSRDLFSFLIKAGSVLVPCVDQKEARRTPATQLYEA